MQMLLKLECPVCEKSFIVEDVEVDQPELSCPFCEEAVAVPEDDDE